jgi:hypothetical protein
VNERLVSFGDAGVRGSFESMAAIRWRARFEAEVRFTSRIELIDGGGL